MNWNAVRPIFEIVRRQHFERMGENPGMVAAIDQDVAWMRDLLEEAEVDEWMTRDVFFVLLGLSSCWAVTLAAEEKGEFNAEQSRAAITSAATTALTVMLAVVPSWLATQDGES